MDHFLSLVAAAGLGGLFSAALQYFLNYRRTYLEWYMNERNNSIIEFLDAVAASDVSDADTIDKRWQKVIYASTKAKLFVHSDTKQTIDNYLNAPGKSKACIDKAVTRLWEQMSKEVNRAPKRF